MIPQEFIRKKRDGKTLKSEEIQEFIQAVTNKSVSEAQVAAFTMAVFFRGMDIDERVALTQAMTNSGKTLSWKNLDGPVVDKHSTGGVGDKVSLMLAPIVAACGGYVPMICGRGLGHTGGTFDKLEAIPGYNPEADWALFEKTVRDLGCCIIGQTKELAPADKIIYGIRDVTATVESLDLITASILSKKLAAGLDGLVMDVKVGNGAFMQNMEEAEALAKSIIKVATGAGMKTSVLITDMNENLGKTAGNAIEVLEAISFLKADPKTCPRLYHITLSLCAEMLISGGLAQTEEEAYAKCDQAVQSGKALEIFANMISALGGPLDLCDHPEKYLKLSDFKRPVYADKTGYVSEIKTRDIGLALIELGGGRRLPNQPIDHSVGFDKIAGLNAEASKDHPLMEIYAKDEETFKIAELMIRNAYTISDQKITENPMIKKRLDKTMVS